MRAKLGLFTDEDGDAALAQDLLKLMQESDADFTLTLRGLAEDKSNHPFFHEPEFMGWRVRWEARLSRQVQTVEESHTLMRAHNPAIIPRNHRVEEALRAATLNNDLRPLHRLLAALGNPFEDRPEYAAYREPGPLDAGYQTFCGT
jgi:serine/tyrosine/threonine adenylyltransferase